MPTVLELVRGHCFNRRSHSEGEQGHQGERHATNGALSHTGIRIATRTWNCWTAVDQIDR